MAGRFEFVIASLAIMTVASACGAGEPKFTDAWVQKNWPESGRAYASFKVQGDMKGWGEGCWVDGDYSVYDEIDFENTSPYDACSKTASIKKWYIRDGYLVGTFRCRIKIVVDGQEKNLVGEVAQEVFADESPVEPGGWPNRGNCKMVLLQAETPVPVGLYTGDRFPDYSEEDIETGKAIVTYVD